MGPDTITVLNGLLAEIAPHPTALMVIATDADVAGEAYATRLTEMAAIYKVLVERAQPPDGLKDWNDVIKARAGRGGR